MVLNIHKSTLRSCSECVPWFAMSIELWVSISKHSRRPHGWSPLQLSHKKTTIISVSRPTAPQCLSVYCISEISCTFVIRDNGTHCLFRSSTLYLTRMGWRVFPIYTKSPLYGNYTWRSAASCSLTHGTVIPSSRVFSLTNVIKSSR